MVNNCKLTKLFFLCGMTLPTLLLQGFANAQQIINSSPSSTAAANPQQTGDGTLSPAAKHALEKGPLPASSQEATAKTEVDRANAIRPMTSLKPLPPGELSVLGGQSQSYLPASAVGTVNVPGFSATNSSPSDSTGAIGPNSYIQTVNTRVGIYNRSTGALVTSDTLNNWAGIGNTVSSFDPQVIWDPTTNRFYYVMDSVYSSLDNRLSIGFSKSSNPANFTSDWCHYTTSYGNRFPDYPKLGDAGTFLLVGVNAFDSNENYLGADLNFYTKPSSSGTYSSCPTTINRGVFTNLKDISGNTSVFTPVPANQIDTNAKGYVIARNLSLPSTNLWIYEVTANSATQWTVSPARRLNVPSYGFPSNATQPSVGQLLDTLDARPTQAVQAINPSRSNQFSLWTQHTIANGNSASGVRWYEINATATSPSVSRTGDVVATNSYLFNAAISPDRRVSNNGSGATSGSYGGSFVVQYSVSSKANSINPRIAAVSSVSGGALTSEITVVNGVGPFTEFTCQTTGSVCRWGDYSSLTPDPASATGGTKGVLYGTNQYSGLVSPSLNSANFRTRIFSLIP